MSFAMPSESELASFFNSDIPPTRDDSGVAPSTPKKLKRRRLSASAFYSPDKKMAVPTVVVVPVAGYVTPPRVAAVAPSTPVKKGPSTPDNVVRSGGWEPITPGKERMYE
jgi:hypothetical protein